MSDLQAIVDLIKIISKSAPESEGAFEVGKSYFLRTVTTYFVGRLIAIKGTDLVFEDGAWVASTGRFSDAVATGKFNEVEPWPKGSRQFVNKSSYVDAFEFTFALPLEKK